MQQCTKMDATKASDPYVQRLAALELFMGDEVSMLNAGFWQTIQSSLLQADKWRQGRRQLADMFGSAHLILFGDCKQLPLATPSAPFIVLPEVHDIFDFKVLH